MNTITPFLWFNNNAEEAAKLYASAFKNSKIGKTVQYSEASANAAGMPKGSIMTVSFELAGQKFTALNGGPAFGFTQAASFFVSCETEEEIDSIWDKLSEGSPEIFWPLQKYPWSEKYGWVTDKYGLSWQLTLSHTPQRISPFLMFDGAQLGKAGEAIEFYTSVFKDSNVSNVIKYGPENPKSEGSIVHGEFDLSGQQFMVMDSGMPKNVNFNEAFSFVVNCETQDEIDYYWDKLSVVPESEMCGWLKDKFGVSWQIVPTALPKLIDSTDTLKAQRVMQSVLKMKKIDIKELQRAYEHA